MKLKHPVICCLVFFSASVINTQTPSKMARQNTVGEMSSTELIKIIERKFDDIAFSELCNRGRDALKILPKAFAEFENFDGEAGKHFPVLIAYAFKDALPAVPEILDRMAVLLHSEKPELALRAIKFMEIARPYSENKSNELFALLEHKEWRVRINAAHVYLQLRPLENSKSLRVITKSYQSDDFAERIAAAQFLTIILRDYFSIEITKQLSTGDSRIVKAYIEILAGLRPIADSKLHEALIKTLNFDLNGFSLERCQAIMQHAGASGFFENYLTAHRPLVKTVKLTSKGRLNARECATNLYRDGLITCRELKVQSNAGTNTEAMAVMKAGRCNDSY